MEEDQGIFSYFTFSLDFVLLEENQCLSLLGLEGLKHLKDELTGQQPCCNTAGNSVSNIGALPFIINNMIQSRKLF